VKDIEFRWLEKRVELNRGGHNTVSRELQFRVLEDTIDSDDYRCKAWSKWRTVPTRFVALAANNAGLK